MRNARWLTAVFTAVWLIGAARPAPASSQHTPPPPRVTAAAWAATAGALSADIIISVPGFPDLSPAASLTLKEAKTRFVAETLMRFADQSQRALRRDLEARHIAHLALWVSNSIFIPSADRATLAWLATRPDVARIDLDVKTRGLEGSRQSTVDSRQSAISILHSPFSIHPSSIEWGVAMVRAPEVWAQGFTGQGIVIADLDTGVQWDHPALKPQYRGWNGITATHDYNWYDPISKTIAYPSDDQGHGTHTTGTLVGDDGAGRQIGVAPGAAWIACRNMDSGTGSVARYTACFQFALAPTDVNGANPDPARAADITSNSWSCWEGTPWYEVGCDLPSALLTVTQVLRQAGVMVVAAAGNEGSACGTVAHSPGIYNETFTVGAVNSSHTIAGFSNRGPSTFTGRVKPDLVAPGVGVNSSTRGGGYGSMSGTSMATPHAAGVVALLWSAAPWLRGQIDETEAIVRRTAQPLTVTWQSCGGVPGTVVPNNTYGYGLIDARAAVSEALTRADAAASAPPAQPAAQPLAFTLVVTNSYQAYTLTQVVLTATLPMSTHFDSASPPGVLNGHVVSWTWDALAPSSVASATLALRVDSPGMTTLGDYGLAFGGHPSAIMGPAASTLAYAFRFWLLPVQR